MGKDAATFASGYQDASYHDSATGEYLGIYMHFYLGRLVSFVRRVNKIGGCLRSARERRLIYYVAEVVLNRLASSRLGRVGVAEGGRTTAEPFRIPLIDVERNLGSLRLTGGHREGLQRIVEFTTLQRRVLQADNKIPDVPDERVQVGELPGQVARVVPASENWD